MRTAVLLFNGAPDICMLTPKLINREAPITSQKQLVDYLAAGARPEAEWGIGAEMEKLVLDARTGAAAEFSRIEALLEALAKTGSWRELKGRLPAGRTAGRGFLDNN